MAQSVYLLHFDTPLKHARHYLGWSIDVESRLKHHLKGTGAKIVAAAVRAGIKVSLVRQWVDKDRNFERQLKNQNNSPRLCPVCNPSKELNESNPQATSSV